MQQLQAALRIDLGCGSVKKEGTIGVDIHPAPGVVDHVLDIETQPLPFADRSVAYVHSSHFLEHTRDIGRIFGEISRVCADGARLELWTPYAWCNGGFILDHKTFFTEDIYLHVAVWFADFWRDILKARWILHEFQYVVEPETICYLNDKGISLDFALRHLHNVCTEFCAHVTISHGDPDAPSPPVRRTFSTGRFESRYPVKADPLAKPIDAPGGQSISEGRREALRAALATFAGGDAMPPL